MGRGFVVVVVVLAACVLLSWGGAAVVLGGGPPGGGGSLFVGQRGAGEGELLGEPGPVRTGQQVEPIVLVPGLSGSALEAKFQDVQGEPHFICSKNKDWHKIWVVEEELFPLVRDCFVHDMFLHFDNSTQTFHNTPGVSVRPQDFGNVTAVQYLATQATGYMTVMIDYFEKHGGYEVMKNLFAAPFDWRYDTKAMMTSGVFADIKALIEHASNTNQGLRVNLIGHSMGGPVCQYFLAEYVDQAWKDKYISNFFSFAGPFGGAPFAVPVMLQSEILGNLNISPAFNNMVARFASVVQMMPTLDVFGKDFVLARVGDRNFTLGELGELLTLGGHPDVAELLDYGFNTYPKANPPGVTTHCMFGYGIPTLNVVTFKDFNLEVVPGIEMADGDTTVTHPSLISCKDWIPLQKEPMNVVPFFNVTHDGMVYTPAVFDYVLERTVHD